ncbi:AAA family ATPase [Klebsiella sp. R390]|uniref:AAA family ATPase n=1 Tax=Klebsiella sp. R390 TaxID=2755400 RepID=UPI003DA8FA2D
MSPLQHILALEAKVSSSILGQERVVRRIILCLLCDANLLLEGMPGLAKTRAIRSLAQHMDATFRRIQFTPDLLPADITGSEIYLPDGADADNAFQFRAGPVFGNLVLVDEINRAPAKVQSALLEAMEERQITVSGKTYPLPRLFMALATQNPVEQEGTYNLPEAQLDRFLMKVLVDYPSPEDEKAILDLVRSEQQSHYSDQKSKKNEGTENEKLDKTVIYQAWQEVSAIHVSDSIKDYIVRIVHVSRYPAQFDAELAKWIISGGSPRASLGLERASRAHAWLNGRDYVDPGDVRAVVHDVLRHRLVLSFQAATNGISIDDVIDKLTENIVVG